MLQLDYCDYSCHDQDQMRIYRPNGLGKHLFLRFYKPMQLVLDDSIVLSRPGACILFTPEYPQDYSAISSFQNSYIHFTDEDDVLSGYPIPINQLFYPNNLEEIDQLWLKIQTEFFSSAKHKHEMIDSLLRQLLIESSRQLEVTDQEIENSALYDSFKQLRLKLLTQCEKNWTVSQLCQTVHLEKSQFYTYYERFFSISPKADLLNVRINKAKQMLVNKAVLVQEVAESCGFTSASHFSRQFKRTVGCSPKAYQAKQLQ